MLRTSILILASTLISMPPVIAGQSLASTSIEIEASAQYVLGDSDSKLDGRRIALMLAKRNALEKAGTYIASITEVKNSQLTHDRIQSYANGIVEVKEVTEKWGMVGSNMAVTLTVKALIDKDSVANQILSLQKNTEATTALEDAKAKIKEYEAKIFKLNREIESKKGVSLEEVKDSRNQALNNIEIESLLAKARVAIGMRDEEDTYLYGSVNPIKREQARRYIEEALKLNSQHPKALIYLASIHLEEKDYAIATDLLRKALQIDPDSALAHHVLAFALWFQGDQEEAIKEVREAIRLKPNYAPPHNNLALALSAQGDNPGALKEFRETIRLKPDHAIAHNNIGYLLLDEGDLDGAVHEFREAIRYKANYAEAHNGLGDALAKKGDLSGATQAYREAIRFKNDYAVAHNSLGEVLDRREDYLGAMQEYRTAVQLEPGMSGYHNNLGLALRKTGNLIAAEQELKDAIKIKPDNAIAHWNLGLVFQDRGGRDSATKEFQEACRLGDRLACQYLRR